MRGALTTRVFDRAGVGPGTRLLDIACGSGYAASVAAGRGAVVAALDASEALIAIARARTPDADFRVGDMFDLPFEDGQFDVVTSFNGIWKGCEDALREARRVVRPGGLVGFTFWGSPKRLGLLPYFATLLELSPPAHVDATLNQGDTGRPGVAEQMLADAAWNSLTGEPRRSSMSGQTLTCRRGRSLRRGHRGPHCRRLATSGSPTRCARRSARCAPRVLVFGSSRVRLDRGTGGRMMLAMVTLPRIATTLIIMLAPRLRGHRPPRTSAANAPVEVCAAARLARTLATWLPLTRQMHGEQCDHQAGQDGGDQQGQPGATAAENFRRPPGVPAGRPAPVCPSVPPSGRETPRASAASSVGSRHT